MKAKMIAGITRWVVFMMLLVTSAKATTNGQYDLSWNTIDGGRYGEGGVSYCVVRMSPGEFLGADCVN